MKTVLISVQCLPDVSGHLPTSTGEKYWVEPKRLFHVHIFRRFGGNSRFFVGHGDGPQNAPSGGYPGKTPGGGEDKGYAQYQEGFKKYFSAVEIFLRVSDYLHGADRRLRRLCLYEYRKYTSGAELQQYGGKPCQGQQ